MTIILLYFLFAFFFFSLYFCNNILKHFMKFKNLLFYLILTLISFLPSSAKVEKETIEEPLKEYTCIQYDDFFEDESSRSFGIKYQIPKNELKEIWRSEQRLTPEALMLAKAELEASNHPVIFRYEKNYKKISSGLFQCLGDDANRFGIEEQMRHYDKMMFWCMQKSNFDIKKSIFLYNTPFGSYKEYPFVLNTYNLYVLYSYM